jgi:hypothetical protein
MKIQIDIEAVEIKQINTFYKICSADFKRAFGIQGEIKSINLLKGRSPNDIENGKSADEDIWEIYTEEIKRIR